MTTALYRRYRPDTFQDVIGQEHVTAPLMAALRADRVTHAYLFSGPRGCGKTTSARILARCLNCERYPTDTPCGQCPSCRDLATGGPGSLDVVEIDAASHNGVDDARDLRERASFAPARDRFKIFILDEAHMVTPQGFNALLKLVEEPPAHVKFIFATTEPEKVIGTIRSRTHHYPFRLVAPDVLEAYLAQLCQSEGVQVGAGVFPLVTRAGGGSVRDTLSVMDQLIGGAVDGQIDYQRAVALLGYTDTTLLDQCVDAIAAADGAGVFRVVDRVISSGHDPRRFVEDLLQRLRDLLVIALAGQEAGPALGSLPADELARMEVQARTLGSGALSRYADMTAQALSQMVGATSPRLQLELLMARLLVPAGAGGAAAPAPLRPTTAPAASSSAPPGGVVASARPADGGGDQSRHGAGGSAWSAQVGGVAASAPAGRSARDSSGGQPWAHEDAQHVQRVGASAVSQAPDARAAHGVDDLAAGGGRPAGEVGLGAGSVVDGPGASSAPEPDRQGVAGAGEAEMIRTRWPEVLDAVRRMRRVTWALLEQHAQPGGVREGVFQLRFASAGLVSTFEHGGHGEVVSQALEQALGVRAQCQAVVAGAGQEPGPAAGGQVGGPVAGGPAGSPVAAGSGAGPAHREAPHTASRSSQAGGMMPGASVRAGGRGPSRAGEHAPEGQGGVSSDADEDPHRVPAAADAGGVSAPGGGHERLASETDQGPRQGSAPPPLAGSEHAAGSELSPDAHADAMIHAGATIHDARSGHDHVPDGPGQADAAHTPRTPTATPEPVGWGQVAPVGRARRTGPDATQNGDGYGGEAGRGAPLVGSGSAGPDAAHGAAGWDGAQAPVPQDVVGDAHGAASAASPSVAPAGAPAPQGSADPGIAHPEAVDSPSGVAGVRYGAPEAGVPTPDDGLAPVRRLHALPAVPTLAGSSSPQSVPSVHHEPTPASAASDSAQSVPEVAGPAGPGGPDGPLAGAGPAASGEAGVGHRQPVHAQGEAQGGHPHAGVQAQHPQDGLQAARTQGDSQTQHPQGSPQAGPSQAAPTFSDGTPLPPEPGDPDGPAPSASWTPPTASLAAAMAAARAAASGHALPEEVGEPRQAVSLEDDIPSEDDEDAEDAGVVGIEVVKRILGATVLEDVIINPEDH